MTRAYATTGPFEVLVYTGGNGDEIAALCESMSVTEDTGTALTYDDSNTSRQLAVGDAVLCSDGEAVQKAPQASMARHTIPVVRRSDVQQRLGMATVPALLLNQSETVAVQLGSAMPDADYEAHALLIGSVGSLHITAVAVVDVDTVNVTVQAGLAYVAGAQLVVSALRY